MAALTKAEKQRRAALLVQGLKYCPHCDRVLVLESFAESKTTSDGRQSYCRVCYASYYETKRTARLEWQRQYAANHAAEVKGRNVAYYEQHREELCQREGARYYENREARRETQRAYVATEQGKEARQTSNHRRKERERANDASLTSEQWRRALEFFGHKCAYCGESTTDMHQEHFIPVVLGGGLTANNIIPACSTCNLSKKSTEPQTWANGRGAGRVMPNAFSRIREYFACLR